MIDYYNGGNTIMEEVLDLLRQNARLSVEDIALMTKKTTEEVKAIIKKFEDDGVILKYAAIINPEKDTESKDKVCAEIEIQVTPEREHGFDALADRIYRFPQVKSLYLMSGGYDLKVIIEGGNLKEVALFVSQKLSTLEGVRSTKTHFILKTYKENDIVYVENDRDNREGVTA
jgi:DNA-binding Lrp family transcriptional regulator